MRMSQDELMVLLANTDQPGDDAQAWLIEQAKANLEPVPQAKPAGSGSVRKPISFQTVIMVLAMIAAIVSHLVKGD